MNPSARRGPSEPSAQCETSRTKVPVRLAGFFGQQTLTRPLTADAAFTDDGVEVLVYGRCPTGLAGRLPYAVPRPYAARLED
jgi:hypothetical protein